MTAHKIRGPYLPVGETEWTCSCGAVAELRDPEKFGGETFRREDFRCPKEPEDAVVDVYPFHICVSRGFLTCSTRRAAHTPSSGCAGPSRRLRPRRLPTSPRIRRTDEPSTEARIMGR